MIGSVDGSQWTPVRNIFADIDAEMQRVRSTNTSDGLFLCLIYCLVASLLWYTFENDCQYHFLFGKGRTIVHHKSVNIKEKMDHYLFIMCYVFSKTRVGIVLD